MRPASGVAYCYRAVEDERRTSLRVLQERLKERFDPNGVLA